MQDRLPAKKDVARALLLRGSVFVHLDPRLDSVSVPSWLVQQPQLVLQVGLDMPIPIPDLKVDDSGIYGTLSFNRSSFTCEVSWDAVFALTGEDGRGMVWPESMPEEIAAEVERGNTAKGMRAAEQGNKPAEPGTLAEPELSLERPTPYDDDEATPSAGVQLSLLKNTQPADTPPVLSPPSDASPPSTSRKPKSKNAKRELPPYLRIVK